MSATHEFRDWGLKSVSVRGEPPGHALAVAPELDLDFGLAGHLLFERQQVRDGMHGAALHGNDEVAVAKPEQRGDTVRQDTLQLESSLACSRAGNQPALCEQHVGVFAKVLEKWPLDDTPLPRTFDGLLCTFDDPVLGLRTLVRLVIAKLLVERIHQPRHFVSKLVKFTLDVASRFAGGLSELAFDIAKFRARVLELTLDVFELPAGSLELMFGTLAARRAHEP